MLRSGSAKQYSIRRADEMTQTAGRGSVQLFPRSSPRGLFPKPFRSKLSNAPKMVNSKPNWRQSIPKVIEQQELDLFFRSEWPEKIRLFR
jgi:hypothetical protein